MVSRAPVCSSVTMDLKDLDFLIEEISTISRTLRVPYMPVETDHQLSVIIT